jgi:hypothetical protein
VHKVLSGVLHSVSLKRLSKCGAENITTGIEGTNILWYDLDEMESYLGNVG